MTMTIYLDSLIGRRNLKGSRWMQERLLFGSEDPRSPFLTICAMSAAVPDPKPALPPYLYSGLEITVFIVIYFVSILSYYLLLAQYREVQRDASCHGPCC